MSSASQALPFSLPIPSTAHIQAEKVSQQYVPYFEKVEQSYLNHLALYTVQYYLRLQGYPVRDYPSQSVNYVAQALSDGMILQIAGYGAISCINLSVGETNLDIPVCIQDDPIAYVAVELNDELSNGSILGFLPQTDLAVVSIDKLQPLTELSQYLAQLNLLQTTTTQLNQWWQRSFNQGWEFISELSAPDGRNLTPAWSTRSASSRETSEITPARQNQPVDGLMCQKTLQLEANAFALVLTMERFAIDSGPSINFEVRLSPNVGQAYLPEGVQLIALDEADNIFSTMRSRDYSPSLELRFRADPGDRFKLKFVFSDITLTEVFEV